MKKVLIVTYSFPPLNNIAARRFSELAVYFKNNGWDPYILTTNNTGDLKQEINEKKVFRIGEHFQKGTVVSQANNNNKFINYLIKVKRKFGFNSRLFDRTQSSWYKNVVKMDLNNMRNHNFDLIIASYRPGSAIQIGNYLSKKLQVPLICDFRDLGALFSDKYEKRNYIFKCFDKFYEKQLLKRAVGITTVSKAIGKVLVERYKKPTQVVYNGWHRSHQGRLTKKEDKTRTIYYAGSFYEHRYDSLVLLLNSIYDIDLKLIIRSLGPEEYNQRMREEIKKLDLEGKVTILPPTSPTEVNIESNSASYNLILEDLDTSIDWKKGNLTGKFLSLLTMEPRILAIARSDSEIGEILKETRKGKIFSNTVDINNFLKNSAHYENQNNEEIEKYSKENQAKILLSFCESIIPK